MVKDSKRRQKASVSFQPGSENEIPKMLLLSVLPGVQYGPFI